MAVAEFLGSAAASRALGIAIIGTAFLSLTIRNLLGWPGLIAIVVALSALAATALLARRRTLEWRGLLTLSLLAFVGWCGLSLLWSGYQWATLAGVLYQAAYALLGVHIALLRDRIQIVRAFGDVLRVMLGASLVLEIFAGALIDSPIPVLDIAGNLGAGGPIQGLFGSRNQLGIVAVLAVITFAIEAASRSVPRGISIGSGAGAFIVLLLTRSPVAVGALAVTIAAAGILLLLRKLTPERRRVAQWTLLGLVVIGLAIAWLARTPIIALLNAGSEFEYRYGVWQGILGIGGIHPLEGFGWLGFWRTELPPYAAFAVREGAHPSAFNTFLDVLLQVGVVGLFLFVVLLGLALVRSWLLAAGKKSIVYSWSALVLVTLTIVAAAESVLLVEFGWLILVICAVRGSEGLSWRSGLREDPERVHEPG